MKPEIFAKKFRCVLIQQAKNAAIEKKTEKLAKNETFSHKRILLDGDHFS